MIERKACTVALVSETRHGSKELCRNGIYSDHECLPWENGLDVVDKDAGNHAKR